MRAGGETGNFPCIEPDATAPPPLPPPALPRRRNYYRRIARARVPWAVVVVMTLIWLAGILYGLVADPSDPETTRALSFLYYDRTLRVAEVLEHSPPLLQKVFSYEGREAELDYAARGLRQLYAAGHGNDHARFALAVVEAELGRELPSELPASYDDYSGLLRGGKADEEALVELAIQLRSGESSVWSAMLLRRAGPDLPLVARRALAQFERENERLFRRLLISSLPGGAALLGGLLLLPHALLSLRAKTASPRSCGASRYPGSWHPSLVIAVVVGMDLAGGAFLVATYGVTTAFDPGFVGYAFIDIAWRILPVAAALGILFRHPRHAGRVLGWDQPVHWPLVLGTFTLLFAAEWLLWPVVERWVEPDPTGGLDRMGFGFPGLIYGLVAACVVAPICEEVVYRGLLLRGLQKSIGFVGAALLSSGIFAAVHFYDWYGTLWVGLFGFAAACVYRATGSLLSVIVLHALFNLSITLPMWSLYLSGL